MERYEPRKAGAGNAEKAESTEVIWATQKYNNVPCGLGTVFSCNWEVMVDEWVEVVRRRYTAP